MAQQLIDLGTGDNTGNGDPLRTLLVKVNDNFSELYSIGGWGYYQDDEATNISVTTTDTLFTINSLGASTNNDYLPLDIRGISDLWSSNKVNAINLGDGYDIRIDFTVNSKIGAPTYLDFKFDIGGGATPSNVIVNKLVSLVKTPPYDISVTFPLFSLATFITNGGQIFLATDVGSISISKRAILIKRDYKNL